MTDERAPSVREALAELVAAEAELDGEVAALIERLRAAGDLHRYELFILANEAADALARLSAQVEAAEKDAERLAKRGQHYRDEMERLSAPVPRQPDHATIRAAYDKWRGDNPPEASEHAAFGAGYYLGRTNG